MTDPIRTLLARVKELDEKATDGPWVMDPEHVSDNGLHYRPARVYVEGWTGYPVNDACEIPLPTNNEDADLIAEYRTLAPQLARALEAVLEVHRKVPVYDDECDDMDCSREHVEIEIGEYHHADSVSEWACKECTGDEFMNELREWPCDTVQAITEHLGGET